MGKALLPVSLELLEQMFALPEGYEIIAVHGEVGEPICQFLIESPDIGNIPEGSPLPKMTLHATMEQHPLNPDFRRLTVTPLFPLPPEKGRS